MARKKRSRTPATNPTRPKLDPRLAFLLSLPLENLKALKEEEDQRLQRLAEEIEGIQSGLGQTAEDEPNPEYLSRLQELNNQLFAPITTGVYFPKVSRRQHPWPTDLKRPYLSAFILSDASAEDLATLGVKVRSQAGDIFTAFIPISLIPRLEASPAVRFIELARPLFPTLDQALPFTQINALHTAGAPVTGAGVIVGIIDPGMFDIYHPDFQTAAGDTRVLFLWDQRLLPAIGEASPPTAPALPGFMPAGGASYGVEYDQATIRLELANYAPAAVPPIPAYAIVRHGGQVAAHGTHVAGIAAGNGRGMAGTYTGAAPDADIIFVRAWNLQNTNLLSDSTFTMDAFQYIFARATQRGQPCVINMSDSDNQGPHDGTALGEQFLDNLLLLSGHAITLSSGNSSNTRAHATGSVGLPPVVTNLILNYAAGANASDDVEIWYDGHDRLSVTVTIPIAPPRVIGPIAPGAAGSTILPNGVQVQVTSQVNDPRNGDNLISIIIIVPGGATIPPGNWSIALTGITIINGNFQAWVDRNNRGRSGWQQPHLQDDILTLGVPSSALRAITVGNHYKHLPLVIYASSGRGPTRDGRVKPEIATVGTNVVAPGSRNMNGVPFPGPGALYANKTGTSMSAPLVAGACALLFQCRGAGTTWAHLKQILTDTAGKGGAGVIPNNDFGFGFLQMANACAQPPINVDVWLRDDPTDTGLEPFTGPVFWLSPDIEVLDPAGNPVPNPTFDPNSRFNNIIRVTVRNRGIQTARNTEVYLYWADPATNILFPFEWDSTGIFTGAPGFVTQDNKIVIPQLPAGGSSQVRFAWAPPAPGTNLRGDDHFCLIVQLDNEADPSRVGLGRFTSIVERNNIALRNVHVQTLALPMIEEDVVTRFYIVGSPDQDSLIVYQDLLGGRVTLTLPIQVLPWRDIRLIEEHGTRRLPYGCGDGLDPLIDREVILEGEEVQRRTDIVGAERLELRGGVATILAAERSQLFVPSIRLLEGTKIPASIRVHGPQLDKEERFVHVAQLSGGQPLGGVTLELRMKEK